MRNLDGEASCEAVGETRPGPVNKCVTSFRAYLRSIIQSMMVVQTEDLADDKIAWLCRTGLSAYDRSPFTGGGDT